MANPGCVERSERRGHRNELRALNKAAANEFIKRVLHNFIVN